MDLGIKKSIDSGNGNTIIGFGGGGGNAILYSFRWWGSSNK